MRRTFLKTIPAALYGTFAAGSLLTSPWAQAADDKWPTKPVRIMMPAAPGGGSDIVGRIVAQALSDHLGQPVIVDNRPGAAGTLGVTLGLQAPADGYTFIWCTPSAQVMAPGSIRYDPVKDLAPVSMLVDASYLLVVNPKLPYRTVQELVQAARANPGSINYATAGTGTFGHLMAAQFALATQTDLVQIPFSGEGPAMVAVMSGEVQMAFISGAGSLPHVKSGKARALGVSSATRMEGVPEDIKPIATSIPGFDMVAVNYMAARAGTPKPIIDKMSQALQTVMAMPAVRDRIIALGVSPTASTPEVLGRRVTTERGRVVEILQRAKIVLE